MRRVRPNPLLLPWGPRGFDPGHVASANISSGYGVSVFLGYPQAVDLLRGLSTVTFQGTDPTTSIDGRIGPATTMVAGGGIRWFDSGISLANDQQATGAAIIVTPGSFGNGALVSVGWSTIHYNLSINSAGNVTAKGIASAFTLATSTPYFVASSCNTTTINFVAVNLLTGQVLTDTQSTSITFSAPDLALITVLSDAGTVNYLAPVSVAMYAPNYLSAPKLLQWARDPWSFWYPRFALNIVGVAAAGGFKPYWANNNNLPVLGTGTY